MCGGSRGILGNTDGKYQAKHEEPISCCGDYKGTLWCPSFPTGQSVESVVLFQGKPIGLCPLWAMFRFGSALETMPPVARPAPGQVWEGMTRPVTDKECVQEGWQSQGRASGGRGGRP